jgi:hypothetical protein
MAGHYDAFISYSHDADSELAPLIERGVERIATPWYRVRSLEVFRDQTGLAVAPELWDTIVAALDRSRSFVLMACAESAGSVWVDREIEHWLAAHGTDDLLLVITDGDAIWDEGRGCFLAGEHHPTSAIPPRLATAFEQEPHWLDLRWARDASAGTLDLDHPRFRSAIAQLAAPLRNMDPDHLESEAIRQRRRALRLAAAAVVLIALLGVVASVAAVRATADRRRAEASTREAVARQLGLAGLALPPDELDLALLLTAAASSSGFDETSGRVLLGRQLGLRGIVEVPGLAPDTPIEVDDDGTVRPSSRPSARAVDEGTTFVAPDGAHTLVLDADGSRLLDRDRNVVATDAMTGRLATMDPSGRLVAVGGSQLVVWDLASGVRLLAVPGVRLSAVEFLDDCSDPAVPCRLVTLGVSLVVWTPQLGTSTVLAREVAAVHLAVSPDRRTIATSGWREWVALWSLEPVRSATPVDRPAAADIPSALDPACRDASIVVRSTSGVALLAVSDAARRARIAHCDARTGALIGSFTLDEASGMLPITAAAISDQGAVVVAGGEGRVAVVRDGLVEDRTNVRAVDVERSGTPVTISSLAISDRAIVAGASRRIGAASRAAALVWEDTAARSAVVFDLDRASVDAVGFVPGGERFVTVESGDGLSGRVDEPTRHGIGALTVWETSSLRRLGLPVAVGDTAEGAQLVLTDDTATVTTPTGSLATSIGGDLADEICAIVGRPLTRAEWDDVVERRLPDDEFDPVCT